MAQARNKIFKPWTDKAHCLLTGTPGAPGSCFGVTRTSTSCSDADAHVRCCACVSPTESTSLAHIISARFLAPTALTCLDCLSTGKKLERWLLFTESLRGV